MERQIMTTILSENGKEIKTYRVTWTVEIEAESEIEAAVEARDIQLGESQFNEVDEYHLFDVLDQSPHPLNPPSVKVVVEEGEDVLIGTLEEERWRP